MSPVAAVLCAAAPAALAAAVCACVPGWHAATAGATVAIVVAGAAAGATVLGERSGAMGAIGWRLGAVGLRIVGIAAGMALLSDRAAVATLLAGVAAGWLVEMGLWTLRLAQERKAARA